MTRGTLLRPALILVFLFSLTSACQTSKIKKKNRQEETVRRIQDSRGHEPAGTLPGTSAGVPDDPTEVDPVYVLRVGTESARAEELWAGMYEELRKQRRLGSMRYERFVAQQAAQIISEKMTEMLLYQHTEVRLPEQSEKQIDQLVDGEIRRVITTSHGGVQRRFERELQKQGSSLEHFRGEMRRQMIIRGFLDQELRPLVSEPTRDELWRLFERNREQWRRPGRKRMSLIELRFTDFLPDDVRRPDDQQLRLAQSKARTRARVLIEELRLGADFATLAKEHSSGVRAVDGGAWDFVEREEVRERYLPVLDKLEELSEGEVSGLLETSDAIFLVRNDETILPYEPSFVDVQVELKRAHSRNMYNQFVEELVEDLRQQSRIDPPDLNRFHAAMVEVALAKDFPPVS